MCGLEWWEGVFVIIGREPVVLYKFVVEQCNSVELPVGWR